MQAAIPHLDYNEQEKETWNFCYTKLIEMFKTNACEEFNWTISEFQKEVNLNAHEVP